MAAELLEPTSDTARIGAQPVSSYTEWDRLTEVVVGRVDDAVFPTWQPLMADILPDAAWETLRQQGGSPFPAALLEGARQELDAFADVLGAEGIIVRRPDLAPHSSAFTTPHWSSRGGLYAAMPRDCLMVVGDTIIEAPMSWRCRYFETHAFRNLLKDYFQAGARWIAGPRPQLTDELYRQDPDEPERWGINEFEPVFDAADFLRFGRDLIAQRSHATNNFGIEWLRRTLGPEFRIHRVDVNDPHAMHIDATMSALAPGKLLVHPTRYLPSELFDGWDVRPAPQPALPSDWPMYMCSSWLSMNVLSLDSQTVVVESHEHALLDMLTDWGFRCLPVDFRHVYSFGGSFHCVTLDVARCGGDETYLSI